MTKNDQAREDTKADSSDSRTASAVVADAHSPLPWRLRRHSADVVLPQFIVDTVGDLVSEDVYLADAEFIVRACNSHEDLLTALKALLRDIDTGLLVRDITRDGEPGWSMHMLAFVQRLQAAQAAIAKAEAR